MATNNDSRRFAVPFKLSYSGRRDSHGFPINVMGTGDAGWTVAEFETREAAQGFADALPLCSRVPNHGVEDRQATPHYLTDAELAALRR